MQRRPSDDDEVQDEYPDELYDMYRNSRSSGKKPRGVPPPQQRSISEEDDASDYDDGSFDENDFEMIPASRPAPRARAPSSSRGGSRRPEIRKIRVKVHGEDTRYIMVGSAIEFPDLVDRIREKFGMRNRFKIKVRDEDDRDMMITMGDQDDLDMVISSAKTHARKERLDVGKFDVSNWCFPP